MPKPRILGKGRGLGVEQLWDEACIENVRLIFESSKNKRINLVNAGRYLFARNKFVGEILLRRYLLEIPREMQETEKLRAEKMRDNSELTELMNFLTHEKVRETINKTQENELTKLYYDINKFEPILSAQVGWIANSHLVFDVLVDTEFPDLTGMFSLSEEALYRRQRSTLAWNVLIHHYGDRLYKLAYSATQQLISKSMSNLSMQPIVWPKT
ncbi:hypothetical protein [Nitrosomonas ureae]|uniref:hypothetical protein n=1 Tax=Nitrosomonas ureae TaxID=44577 RepID=UPI00115FED53|nr:hypothetical protein [Nitrosomonas ureae]